MSSSNRITVRKTIESRTRLLNSYMGNPAYRYVFTDGSSARTATDAGFVYGDIPADGAVLVTINGRGSIVDIARAEAL